MAPEAEKDGEFVFDKQTFLVSYYEEIADTVQKLKYDYVYLLNHTKDAGLSTCISVLTDKIDSSNFIKLKTYQYNAILPKIRLFRLEYNDDKSIKAQKQFIFEKDAKYTVENMTQSVIRNNSGIKSINWKLAGSNPVTAEKQVELQIKFFFDSINSFSGGSYDSMVSAWANSSDYVNADFSFCDTDTTTKNYWSLIFHPQLKNDKDKYDTFDFRIKAIVGWEDIGENIKSQLNISQEVEDEIKKLNYGFFLTLIKHQFNLNEDGSIELTTDYIASFENETSNYNYNILGILPDEIKSLSSKTGAELLSLAYGENGPTADDVIKLKEELGVSFEEISKNFKTVAGASQNEIEKLNKLYQTLSDSKEREKILGCDATPQKIKDAFSVFGTGEVAGLNSQQDQLQKAQNLLTSLATNANMALKRKYYSYFIKKLMEQKEGQEKFFAIDLTPEQIKNWKNWYLKYNNVKPSLRSTPNNSNNAVSDVKNSVQQDLQKEIIEYEQTTFDTVSETVSGWWSAANEQVSGPENTKIVFTTFGAIVDVAYQVVESHLNGTFNSDQPNMCTTTGDTESEKRAKLVLQLKRLKTIIGNISEENQIFDTSTNTNTKIKNLAFAPIEIDLLKQFLVENMIKPKKEQYSLFSFIKDVLSSIVVHGVNSFQRQNDEVDKYANISLASILVNLGNRSNEGPLETLFMNEGSSIIEGVNLIQGKDKLEPYYINLLNNDHRYYYTYNLLYDKTMKDFVPLNDPEGDAKNGIFHFTYGQDYGLIKSINFSRADQPYLKEAKAVGKQTFYLGQFRDRYNADITMIGNNLYYPGMILYIRPSVEASGTPSKDKPNFSQISGIGGYYFVHEVESSITEDGYETKLKTIWQHDGYEEPKLTLTPQEECKAMLIDAGIIDDNGNPTANALDKILDNNTIASLEAEIVELKKEREDMQIDIVGINNDAVETAEGFWGTVQALPVISEIGELGEATAILFQSEQERQQRIKNVDDITRKIEEREEKIRQLQGS